MADSRRPSQRLGKIGTVLGEYNLWAERFLGRKPGRLSWLSGNFKSIGAWKKTASARVWELLAAPPLPRVKPKIVAKGRYDGVIWEKYQWQMPWGPPTEAVFLKPASAKPGQRLPGVLALHCHGGNKYHGWQKIADISRPSHPTLLRYRNCYGGLAWANELAKRGYAVLVPDAFLFGSRRIHVDEIYEEIRAGVKDPGPHGTPADIEAYNEWAAMQEHYIAKALFCAGTTWPSLFLREDQAALDVLCSRRDVDAKRVGCGGLSGGATRTIFLAGLDERVRCCFCTGFFTTWSDMVRDKAWMSICSAPESANPAM